MGYSTEFSGSLEFEKEISVTELAELQELLGNLDSPHGYIDLEITKGFKGLEWNGAEKSYGMVENVNLIIKEMRKNNPTFGLSGSLSAQGEDHKDRWSLVMKDGIATKVDNPRIGQKVCCPHCDEEFILEGKVSTEE